MKKYILFFFLLGLSINVLGSDTLTVDQFKELVLKNHPLVKSADLYDEIAEAYLQRGRGALDPTLNSDFDAKDFDSKKYFQRWNSEIKIPTRYPIDFSVGYEENSGEFLNNDEILPNNGLAYGTISVSVLRGLMFDEQRFKIEQSKLLSSKSRIEQEIIIREIIIQSLKVYLEWSSSYYELEVLEEYQNRVSNRHNFVIQLFENGDKPAIDTIESRINLNTATKDVLLAKEKLNWKQQKLNFFLWDEEGKPLILLDSIVPDLLDELVLNLGKETMLLNPVWEKDLEIRKKSVLIEQLELNNRLEREQLKPALDIKYNTIHNLGDDELAYSFGVNDYKLGASISVPIRNRETRGKIKLNEALIDQNTYDQSSYLLDLELKYNTLLENQTLRNELIKTENEKLLNSEMLYNAERLKFELGESTVFLLNSRERKLLESQIGLLKGYKNLGLLYCEMYFMKLGQ